MTNFIYYNPNPKHKSTGDCVIRMLCCIYDLTWREAYLALSEVVLNEYEMPSDNDVWEKYLKLNGFRKGILDDECPDCMTVREFATVYSQGIFVVCTGRHVVSVVDGNYYDAWDSGNEVVSYFFYE